MQDRIFQMLMQENEITWQSIIYDLVRTEEMDPWDIDLSVLANRYLEIVRNLKKMNFAISGKVILASAILLKLKSKKLIEEDLARFNEIINPPEEIDLLEEEEEEFFEENKVLIVPKMPQPRRRRIGVEDLVSALERALDVTRRRNIRQLMYEAGIKPVEIPKKKIDINQLIRDVYSRLVNFFSKGGKKLTFTSFVNSDRKEDKIMTFLPLLHLDNDRKIDLHQEKHFGEIEIWMK